MNGEGTSVVLPGDPLSWSVADVGLFHRRRWPPRFSPPRTTLVGNMAQIALDPAAAPSTDYQILVPARLFPELFPGARRLVGVQVQRSISGVRKNKFPGKHKKTVAELGVTNPTPRCRHARPPTFQTVTSSYAGKAITQVPEKGSF